MNLRIDENWLTAGRKWTRAILIEAAEAVEHYGYKWWKKQTPDMPQVQMELVDIWHFMLSAYVESMEGNSSQASTSIIEEYNNLNTNNYPFNGESLIDNLDLLAGKAGHGEIDICLFLLTIQSADMTWDDLVTQYFAKNVLNFFRQDHGYNSKDVEYIKVWNDKEDNEHLAEILLNLKPKVGTNLFNSIYTSLSVIYPGEKLA